MLGRRRCACVSAGSGTIARPQYVEMMRARDDGYRSYQRVKSRGQQALNASGACRCAPEVVPRPIPACSAHAMLPRSTRKRPQE